MQCWCKGSCWYSCTGDGLIAIVNSRDPGRPRPGHRHLTVRRRVAWNGNDRRGQARYRFDMAFVVKLSPEDTEALREQAAREHRSMHEVAVLAIQARVAGERRAAMLDVLFDRAAAEDAELLDRLAR